MKKIISQNFRTGPNERQPAASFKNYKNDLSINHLILLKTFTDLCCFHVSVNRIRERKSIKQDQRFHFQLKGSEDIMVELLHALLYSAS